MVVGLNLCSFFDIRKCVKSSPNDYYSWILPVQRQQSPTFATSRQIKSRDILFGETQAKQVRWYKYETYWSISNARCHICSVLQTIAVKVTDATDSWNILPFPLVSATISGYTKKVTNSNFCWKSFSHIYTSTLEGLHASLLPDRLPNGLMACYPPNPRLDHTTPQRFGRWFAPGKPANLLGDPGDLIVSKRPHQLGYFVMKMLGRNKFPNIIHTKWWLSLMVMNPMVNLNPQKHHQKQTKFPSSFLHIL